MSDHLRLTAQIVSAFVGNSHVSAAELPNVISGVYRALFAAGTEPASVIEPQPAVPIKKSVFPDYIVCLEDGKHLTILRGYLAKHYNMTPEQYRSKWNLPQDYPMVAPNYTAIRSGLAKKFGLGQKALASQIKVTRVPAGKRGTKRVTVSDMTSEPAE